MGEVIEISFDKETDADRAEEVLDDMLDAAEAAEIPPYVMILTMSKFIEEVFEASGGPLH